AAEHVVQFDATRRTLPRLDMYGNVRRNSAALRGSYTGGAWLSSARAVRCWVKSRNERNPCPMLPAVRPGTHRRLPVTNRRKVGTTSSHHAPYAQGYTRATLATTEGCDTARWSESQKGGLGSDW